MKQPIVLGISGHKRSGKDEVYRAIAQHFSDVHRIAFGDFVKEELCEACGVSRQFLDDHKEQFRLGMQWWGTEFRRELFGDDYWINRARDRFQVVKAQGARIVVFTDCRFPNEARLIKSLGGKIWRAIRNQGESDTHPSETSLHGFIVDRGIDNYGPLSEYHDKVRTAFYEDFIVEPAANIGLEVLRAG